MMVLLSHGDKSQGTRNFALRVVWTRFTGLAMDPVPKINRITIPPMLLLPSMAQ